MGAHITVPTGESGPGAPQRIACHAYLEARGFFYREVVHAKADIMPRRSGASTASCQVLTSRVIRDE